ncbi:MAG: ATP-binding protein [Verrucomicrobiota bacterium]
MFTERYELSFRRNIPSAFMSRRLDRRSLREIYYFIKESINNAHKHAQAQRLSLQIGLESETFTVVIADDGVGFQVEKYEDPSSELTGFGLKSLKRRAFHLKGNLEICSTPNRGTVIQLEFPAKRILV